MTQPFGHSTLLRRLELHAWERPDKPFAALYRGEQFRVLTYGELRRDSERWARRLAVLNAGPGGAVFLVLRHGADAYGAFLGAMQAGLVPTFLPPPSPKQEPAAFWAAQRALFARTRPVACVAGRIDAAELVEIAASAGCALLVAEDDPPLADLAALADPEPQAAALVQLSSGTTGLKKAVRLSFEQVDRHVGMLAAAVGFTADDVVASWLPLYHDMGLFAAFLAPLTLGASVVAIDPFAWVADPASILRAIARHRATLTWAPNFAFAHLSRTHDPAARYDLSSLRAMIDCSEPCRPETIETFCGIFHGHGLGADRIACCYGMAEAVFAATQTQIGEPPKVLEVDAERLEAHGEIVGSLGGRTHRFMSCGKPLAGVDLRIAASDRPLSPGAIPMGEVEIASATLFDGYHHGEGPPVDPPTDGWRSTGDVGFLHDGELYICGRTMERLIVHGRNLYAGDIEAVASQVSGVKPGRAVALGVIEAALGAEEAWVMLEAEGPLIDAADREALVKAVRSAVQNTLDVTLRGVEIGPPGWLAKSTSGKMSRSANLEKLNRLLAHRPTETAVEATPPAAPDPPDPSNAPTPVAALAPVGVVRAAVRQALAECFGRDGARLGDRDGIGDAPGWDSLGHTVLVLRIEALTGLTASENAAQACTVGGLVVAFEALATPDDPVAVEERRAA